MTDQVEFILTGTAVSGDRKLFGRTPLEPPLERWQLEHLKDIIRTEMQRRGADPNKVEFTVEVV